MSLGGQSGVKHCFDDLPKYPSDDTGFHFHSDPEDAAFEDILTIEIKKGSFCYFTSQSNVLIEGSAQTSVYYFEYAGYGPKIWLGGDDLCKFQPRANWQQAKGQMNIWFKPNLFGGSCGYLYMLGVSEFEDSDAIVTITRKQSAGSLGYSVLAALAALMLISY